MLLPKHTGHVGLRAKSSQFLVIAPSLLPEVILTDIIRLAPPASQHAINSHACDKEVTLQVQG